MKFLSLLVTLLTISLSFMACNYRIDKIQHHDNSDLLQKMMQNSSMIGFDSIKSTILQDKCLGCHSAGQDDLSTYEKFVAHSGKVIEVLGRDSMPKKPNPPLSPMEKQVIQKWVSMGMPEKSKVPLDLPPEEPLSPTFHSIKKNIIDKKCISCHLPGGEAMYYPFDTYEDVVDPFFGALKPGDPDKSNMVIYPSKPDSDKERMPPPEKAPRLSDEEINAIKIWIKNGAKND